jgi:uncharacterized protein with FMN-binding domain
VPSRDRTVERQLRGGRSRLQREALSAQSVDIHTVSGATYTSDAYRMSLQSALDKART